MNVDGNTEASEGDAMQALTEQAHAAGARACRRMCGLIASAVGTQPRRNERRQGGPACLLGSAAGERTSDDWFTNGGSRWLVPFVLLMIGIVLGIYFSLR